jgi:hypothetical protein
VLSRELRNQRRSTAALDTDMANAYISKRVCHAQSIHGFMSCHMRLNFRYHDHKPISTHLSCGMATVMFIIVIFITSFNMSTLVWATYCNFHVDQN